MKVFVFFLSLAFSAELAVAQGNAAKSASFGNATIDKYIASVNEFVGKQKGLSSTLTKLDGDFAKASKEEDGNAIDGIAGRLKDLEGSYKSLDVDSKKISTDGTTASKASSQCGTKAPKCAEGVKKATALLNGSLSGVVSDKSKMTALKAKVEAAKAKFGSSGH